MNDMASLLPTSAKFHFTNKLRNTMLEYSLNYFTKCKLYLGCIKKKALVSRRYTMGSSLNRYFTIILYLLG